MEAISCYCRRDDRCAGRHSIFQLCGGKVDFCFLPPTPTPKPTILLHLAMPEHTVSHIVASEIEVLDGDGRSHMRSTASSDLAARHSAGLGSVSTHVREVVDTIVAFHGPFSLPPPSLFSIHLR